MQSVAPNSNATAIHLFSENPRKRVPCSSFLKIAPGEILNKKLYHPIAIRSKSHSVLYLLKKHDRCQLLSNLENVPHVIGQSFKKTRWYKKESRRARRWTYTSGIPLLFVTHGQCDARPNVRFGYLFPGQPGTHCEKKATLSWPGWLITFRDSCPSKQ